VPVCAGRARAGTAGRVMHRARRRGGGVLCAQGWAWCHSPRAAQRQRGSTNKGRASCVCARTSSGPRARARARRLFATHLRQKLLMPANQAPHALCCNTQALCGAVRAP
jgi:hypothetical protein